MKIIYNGKVYQQESFFISPLSKGFNYGEGFFTTIKVINKVAENLELHVERILSSLKYFSFNIELPPISELITEVVNANNLNNARIKMTFFNDTDGISYILFCEELVVNNDPVKLELSPYFKGNDSIYRYKSLNYYTNLTSGLTIYKDSKKRVLETGFANIFIIKKNKIITPPKSLPIIPGTFREYLLRLKSIDGFKIIEKDIYVKDLHKCDEVFITNSIRGITPVYQIDNIKYGTDTTKEIIKSLNIVTN